MSQTILPYAGLIFDCDGTLVDTMPAHYVAWTATLAKYGVTLSEERFYALGGVPTDRIVAMLAEESGVAMDAAAVADEKERLFHESADALCPVESVVAIAAAHRGVVPMSVATGSRRWAAEKSLGQIGVLDWFVGMVTADETEHPKPHAEVFIKAAALIEIDPAMCCAFEDTDLGIASARAAGMDVVDVRTLM